MNTAAPDLLATIVAATRRIVQLREAEAPVTDLERHTQREPRGGAFVEALRTRAAPRIIAECKRRSPSRGILREDYDPASHARGYEAAGAAAVSVLTEPTFFDGAPEHLRQVRDAVSIPLLRKDFIVTEYQVCEAAFLGADAILVIAGALEERDLRRLLVVARSRRLAALVEVHDELELARAADAGAEVIGVNSRDLRTLQVDHAVSERLIPAMPEYAIKVAESGIHGADDIRRLGRAGFDAFLIGERFMTQRDPGAALAELRIT